MARLPDVIVLGVGDIEHAGRYQLVMIKEGSDAPLAEMLHDFAENAAMFGAFGGKWDEKAAAAAILAIIGRQRAALEAIADGEGDSSASQTATRLARAALAVNATTPVSDDTEPGVTPEGGEL